MQANKTTLISVFLISLVLFPVFIFLFKLSSFRVSWDFLWIEVLVSSFLQAGLSTFFAILFGFFGSLGLLALTKKRVSLFYVELFCLLPALLPPLVPVLAWVNVSEFFFKIPFSFFTVVCAHLLMNTGLVSVFFFRLFCAQTDNLPAWAFLHKVSLLSFMRKMLFFEWRKDLALLSLLVFSFCFTSFSVPLLVGGVSGQTLEVFIAEKLKNPSAWPEALFLFFVETIFIFLFFILLYGRRDQSLGIKRETKLFYGPFFSPNISDQAVFFRRFSGVKFLPFLLLPILPSLLIFLGLGDVFSSDTLLRDLLSIKKTLLIFWARTLLVGISTGVFVFVGLCFVAFCLRDLFLRRFLVAYSGSSVAFMGFAFLLIGSDSSIEVWLKWSLGLSLLFLPPVYRLMGESLLRRLSNQVQLADLMGAGRKMSFLKIVLPQSVNVFLFLSGVSAFWASGDFAYSSIVAGEEAHLALLIQDLFSSYRFELATALTWILIFTGMFCFSLFMGVAFVFYKKSDLPAR